MAGRDRLATESVDHAVAEGGVEPGRVGSAAGNGGKAGDRHEGARVAGGPARRPELAEADVRRREPERGGDRRGVRRRSHLGRSLRNREAGAAMPVRHRLERAAHRPDLLFQHDLAAGGGAVAQPEQHRGPHRRVACERSSRAEVKMRTRARWAEFSGANTNTVSGWLNSRATACIAAVSSPSLSSTTASGLPAKRRSVNTSSVTNCRRIGSSIGHSAATAPEE
jgi:hypothetical protein